MPLSADLQEIPQLFGDAVEQLGKLVQNEAQLARAEITQKAAQALTGAALIGAAALLCVPVLVMLLMALAAFLQQNGMGAPASYLVSAAAAAVVAGILGLVGRNALSADKLTPAVTLDQMHRDVAAAKEMTR